MANRPSANKQSSTATRKAGVKPRLRYSDELADSICKQIADGASLRQVCTRPGMPVLSAAMNWIANHSYFEEQYTRARELQADAIFDALDDVSEEAVRAETSVAVHGLRLKADNIKWKLARMSPKKYGDKLEIDNRHSLREVSDDQLLAKLGDLGIAVPLVTRDA